jgi:hypothetical protein
MRALVGVRSQRLPASRHVARLRHASECHLDEASDASLTNDERRGAFGHRVGHLSSVHEPRRVIDGDTTV